jgi:hypothetical protein
VREINPQARLRWIEKLAADFPGEHAINITLCWENRHGVAGVYSFPNEAHVFLNNNQQNVESIAEAAGILRQIFADEVVAVTAYAKDQVVFSGLAPASEPSSGFHVLDGRNSTRDMPDIDQVTIETWSGGLVEKE